LAWIVSSLASSANISVALTVFIGIFALLQGHIKAAVFNVSLWGFSLLMLYIYNRFGWSDVYFSRYSFVVLRNMTPAFFALHIVMLTPPSEITEGLDKLKFPKGTAVAVITLFRYFPTIGTELKSVFENMRIRGILSFKNAVLRPFLTVRCILLPLLTRALNVAEELSISAVTRGAESKNKRSSFYGKRFDALDAVILLTAVAGFTYITVTGTVL
jgi:energy-coupling factor transport system permease protein